MNLSETHRHSYAELMVHCLGYLTSLKRESKHKQTMGAQVKTFTKNTKWSLKHIYTKTY